MTVEPQAHRPGALERTLDRIPEGGILLALFYAMLASAVAVLYLDLSGLLEADDGRLPGLTLTAPVPMQPPRPSDQVRPYLPRAMPALPDGEQVSLPGYAAPPDMEMLGARMVFRTGADGRISAVGRIEPGTAEEFERFVAGHEVTPRLVVLHSPGGAVGDALQMAAVIREAGMKTAVPSYAYCASSCPLVFAGGEERLAGSRAWVGVHQVYALPSALGNLHDGMAQAQAVSALCQSHLLDMGVDARVWVAAMRTPKEQLYMFTEQELVDYKLASAIAEPK